METPVPTDRPTPSAIDQRAKVWDRLLLAPTATAWHSLRSASLTGKRVLITGAGGSIGSALAQAVAASMPERLILFDSSENGLYQVDRSLRECGSGEHVSLLGSVCNADTVEHALSAHQPEIIFHAAALKHVPLMEQNPFAAIENNVFGTLTLSEAAIAHHVEQIVLVSTDKAVDPRSMMGASKRIAELLLLTTDSATHRTAVRLCNVMGSQGSVLPLFVEQIAKGGPVTVTHPEVQRYFVTMVEAVRALLQALEHRSSPALLLPDMGPAIRIVDLAQHLIESHSSGATLAFTGLRPGDKLAEQLVSDREVIFPRVEDDRSTLGTIETPIAGAGALTTALSMLREAIHERDLKLLLRGVAAIVPEYQPSSVITAALNQETALELASELQA